MEDIIENSILQLFEDFKQNPEIYENERILTYKFYDIILQNGFQGYKFRWEYPTKAFYKGNIPDISGTNKKMDICFIEEDSSNSVPYALEFKLLKPTNKKENNNKKNKFNQSGFDSIDPDFDELVYSENMIGTGFIIFFAFIKFKSDNRKKKRHTINKGEFISKFDRLNSKIGSGKTIKILFGCVENIDGLRTCYIKHNFNNGSIETVDEQY